MEEVRPLSGETVQTIESAGRVLAAEVRAGVTIPPWKNSSMDGYAVRAADVSPATSESPVVLPVVASIAAGKFPPRELRGGEAMRIMTGAPVPSGADSVVRIEDTDGEGAKVSIRSARDAGKNVRPAGEDFQKGNALAEIGAEMTPSLIGVFLSAGITGISVSRRPKVGIISSGDELVLVDEFQKVLLGKKIVSTNSYTLPALVRDAGGEPIDFGIAGDSAEALREKFEQARGCDLIITTAGISVGDADHTRAAFASLGGREKFWKVKIRPGAPLAFGEIFGVPWLGLSGNPVSAVVTFELFARPVIRRMLGHHKLFRRPLSVMIQDDVTIAADLTHFLRVRLSYDGSRYEARLTRSQSSASLSSLAAANALLVVPPDSKHYPAGSILTALPLDEYPFELAELSLA